jgi:aminoglycoside phosphotransferase (APT) family kinase protein
VIDVERLGAWMDGAGLGDAGAPIETRFVSGGTQNEIYEVRRGQLHCALRIPPPEAPAPRDEGIVREWRIIEALGGTDVPHTPAVAACTDPAVLGRTFYLMGYVDGWSPMGMDGWPAPFDADLDTRRGLAFELVDGIALLSKVDWRAKGLADLGRPDGFHERQVDRWTAFLERIKGRELPGFDEASAWLRAHRPLDYVPGIMHGDYQFANVMFRDGAPARLAAIVDWEMGTVGDPKLDLAWVVQGWPEDTSDPGDAFTSYVDMKGMPAKGEVLARYAEVSGRQVDDIDYYAVLARWKLAVVLEQGYQRAGDDEKLQAFGPVVLKLMQDAADLAATQLTCAPRSAPSTGRRRSSGSRTSRRRRSGPVRRGSGSGPPRSTSRTCCSARTATSCRCRRRSCRAASSRGR